MIRVEGNYFSFIPGEIKQTQEEIIVQLLGYIEDRIRDIVTKNEGLSRWITNRLRQEIKNRLIDRSKI